MMGYAQVGIAPWILGALAVAGLWAGVWILLSAIGIRDPHRRPAASSTRPGVPLEWHQPLYPGSEAEGLSASAGRDHRERRGADYQEEDHR